MRRSKFFGMVASAALTFTSILGPLSVYGQSEEVETEEILDDNLDSVSDSFGEDVLDRDDRMDAENNGNYTGDSEDFADNYQTDDSNRRKEYKGNHGSVTILSSSELPDGLTAHVEEADSEVAKLLEAEGAKGYTACLLDKDGTEFTGQNAEYNVTLYLPEEMQKRELNIYGVALYENQVSPDYKRLKYTVNKDKTSVTFEVFSLDGSDFRRKSAEPIWVGYIITEKTDYTTNDSPNSGDTNAVSPPSVNDRPNEVIKPTWGMSYNAPGYGAVSMDGIKADIDDDAFILMEEADRSYEPYPGKKSKSISVKYLDNDNNEYFFDDKGVKYTVSLTTPAEFLGHEIKVDMVEPSVSGYTDMNPTFTPIEYQKKRGGRTLVFNPSGLNRIFVITDMDSQMDESEIKENPFDDVKEGEWYYDYVVKANEAGLMTGLTSTHFGPNDKMSRAMVVTVLYRMAGSPNVSDTKIFPDVPTGQWYSKAVKWANQNKIVTGYENGQFGPNDNVTREQLATMIYRYQQNAAGKSTAEKDSLNAFPDKGNVSSFAKNSVQYCVAKGIITGSHGWLLPVDEATRAECAKMLLVAYNTK